MTSPTTPEAVPEVVSELELEERARSRARKEARQSLPGVYVDTWATLVWRGHIRIALGEEFSNDDYYRYCAVMTLDIAEDFARHLLDRIERAKEKYADTKEDPEAEA